MRRGKPSPIMDGVPAAFRKRPASATAPTLRPTAPAVRCVQAVARPAALANSDVLTYHAATAAWAPWGSLVDWREGAR